MRELIDNIQTLVQARYPIVLLVTYEEDRVERVMAEVATSEGRDLYQWTSTQCLLS